MKIKQCYMLILSPSGIKLETRLVNNDYIQFQLRLRELEMEVAADVGPFLSRMSCMYIQQLVYHLFSVKQLTPV